MSGSPAVLLLHAADPAADEGIAEDAATLRELGCRPELVTTAVLLRARGRAAVAALDASLVEAQFAEAVGSEPAVAVRTGILSDAKQVETVASLLRQAAARNVVCAPVARMGGTRVLEVDAVEATRRHLFPLARVVIVRARDLPAFAIDRPADLEGLTRAAAAIRARGARAALVSGGGWDRRVVDVLDDEGRVRVFDSTRVVAPRVTGVAGTHPAAIAAFLARGEPLERSADAAQRHVGLRLDRS